MRTENDRSSLRAELAIQDAKDVAVPLAYTGHPQPDVSQHPAATLERNAATQAEASSVLSEYQQRKIKMDVCVEAIAMLWLGLLVALVGVVLPLAGIGWLISRVVQ